MKVKIYQIPKEVEEEYRAHGDSIMFTGLDILKHIGVDILWENYEKKCEYEITKSQDEDDIQICNRIFRIFNQCDRPNSKTMRSLSVSDVVEFENKLFFCDSYGWEKITCW